MQQIFFYWCYWKTGKWFSFQDEVYRIEFKVLCMLWIRAYQFELSKEESSTKRELLVRTCFRFVSVAVFTIQKRSGFFILERLRQWHYSSEVSVIPYWAEWLDRKDKYDLDRKSQMHVDSVKASEKVLGRSCEYCVIFGEPFGMQRFGRQNTRRSLVQAESNCQTYERLWMQVCGSYSKIKASEIGSEREKENFVGYFR